MNEKKSLLVIFLVIFIDLLGFGILIPILPYYAKEYGANALTLGWLMTTYSAMQLLFSPLWGDISDRWGRRRVLLLTTFGMSIAMAVMGIADSLFLLFVGRLIAGFFGANLSAASAYIADVTTEENRAKGMGLIGAAFGFGFLFGPPLGGYLSQFGYGTAAFFGAGLSLFNCIFAFFVLKEPENKSLEKKPGLFSAEWFNFLKSEKILIPCVLFFFMTFSIAQIETSFALFAFERFGLTAQKAGLVLGVMAIINVLIQGGGIGKLVARFGETKLLGFASLLMPIALVGMASSYNLGMFVIFVAVHAVGYSLSQPSLLSLVSKGSPAKARGAVMGVYQSFGSMARIFGPLMAGFLFDDFGISVPFLFAGLMVVVVAVIVFSTKKSFA